MRSRPSRRSWTRRIALTALALLVAFGVYLHGQYVPPVLMYHRIDDQSAVSALSVAPESFARQMALLHRHARVVQLKAIVERIVQGQPPDRGAVAITFDDGFESVYTEAYPVLRRYGLPATAFIVTDWVGTPGYMTWEQIRELAASGWTIGAHTRTHPWLPAVDETRLQEELAGAQRVLREQVPGSAEHFSYPMGAYDARVKRAVQAVPYASAAATNPGRLNVWRDPYALKRLRISRSSDNLVVFWIETSGYYTWIKEHRGKHLWHPKPAITP